MRAARAGQSAALLGCAHSPRTRLALRLAGCGVGTPGSRQGMHIEEEERANRRAQSRPLADGGRGGRLNAKDFICPLRKRVFFKLVNMHRSI